MEIVSKFYLFTLLVNALRQTPDYIVPGEVRSPEEFEVGLAAAQTGHNVFTTYHAEDPEDAIYRFLNAVLKISSGAPAELILRDICAAFRFIINVKRLSDGSRRVMYISEVLGSDGLNVHINHLYRYKIDRVVDVEDEVTGKIVSKIEGRHIRMNAISPWFIDKLQQEGIAKENFEFFTTEPERMLDENGDEVLDDMGDPIILEMEPEYRHKGLGVDIEEIKRKHKERKLKKRNKELGEVGGLSADVVVDKLSKLEILRERELVSMEEYTSLRGELMRNVV